MISGTSEYFSFKKLWFRGQITNFGLFRVKFRSTLKVGKLYIKMTLLTSEFQKRGREVTRGHPRSKIWKKGQIFNLHEIRQIIYQNHVLDINFSIKVVGRSTEVIWGQKSREYIIKGRIWDQRCQRCQFSKNLTWIKFFSRTRWWVDQTNLSL